MTNDQSTADASLTVEQVCAVIARAIASRHGSSEPVTPDTEILLTGMIDSLTLVRIVADLEASLGRKLPEDLVVARNFRTPTTLYTSVTAVLAEATL